eukprot:CAMPEP_0206216026 /NCGR_PEP_ID=MMETSP0047_2-20121206/2504_1 /ASSEMBLY_ACC=CAM_ASM_000192 /TAXON_ID=195065 /ORGANISM="Chroomonas mesostigmatica_cf, Strain CCMP1168" /LENGTH=364 /DNA_ID=CAMNT_0053638351 /DNA_START=99 /DNA_END=1189 /DNA_ORIENTATION=+
MARGDQARRVGSGNSTPAELEDLRAKKSAQQFQSMLEDRKKILAHADKLAHSTTKALRHLQKKLGKLQKDVAPVHDQTRTLHLAHTNMGMAITSVQECVEKLRVIQPLHEKIVSGDISNDVEGFMAALHELNNTITFAREHSGLRDLPEVMSALMMARNQAISKLESEYSRMLAAQRPSPTDEDADQPPSKSLQRLINLRDAMVESEASNCVDVFVGVRSTALAAQMRALEEGTLRGVKSTPDLDTHKYTKGKHPFLTVPRAVLNMLRGETRLAQQALPEGDDAEAAAKLCGGPASQLVSLCTTVLRLDAPGQSPGRVLALLDVLGAMRDVQNDLVQVLMGCDKEVWERIDGLVTRLEVKAAEA